MSSPTLDETLRTVRREAIATLSAGHDTALHADIDRTLSPENWEKLTAKLLEHAAYTGSLAKISEDKFTFTVGIRLIEVLAFANEHKHGAIKGDWYSENVPLSTLMGPHIIKTSEAGNTCVRYPHIQYYATHPLVAEAVSQIKEKCGPTTVNDEFRMRIVEGAPTLHMVFSIPTSVSKNPA